MIIIIVSTICFVGYAVVCFEQRSVLFLVAASFCIFVFVVDDRQWNRVGERERETERERGVGSEVYKRRKKNVTSRQENGYKSPTIFLCWLFACCWLLLLVLVINEALHLFK